MCVSDLPACMYVYHTHALHLVGSGDWTQGVRFPTSPFPCWAIWVARGLFVYQRMLSTNHEGHRVSSSVFWKRSSRAGAVSSLNVQKNLPRKLSGVCKWLFGKISNDELGFKWLQDSSGSLLILDGTGVFPPELIDFLCGDVSIRPPPACLWSPQWWPLFIP